VFIELYERAKIANDSKADLFICIHANSGQRSAMGTETYVMGLHKTEANLQVAKRENSVILMESDHAVHYEGFDPNSDEDIISLTLYQSAFLEQSLNFAARLQKKFVQIGRKDRGVKQAGFLVLYKTTMPSVLIETGFLSNKEEEKFLKDGNNQQRIASSVYEAFREYKEDVEQKLIGITKSPDVVPEKERKEERKEKRKGEENETKNPPLYPEENNEEETREDGLVFKVQLIASSQKVLLNPENFKGLTEVIEYKEGEIYKYVVGHEKDLVHASEKQQEIKEKGFKDAFVVAFYNGNRIPVSEALKLLQSKNE